MQVEAGSTGPQPRHSLSALQSSRPGLQLITEMKEIECCRCHLMIINALKRIEINISQVKQMKVQICKTTARDDFCRQNEFEISHCD